MRVKYSKMLSTEKRKQVYGLYINLFTYKHISFEQCCKRIIIKRSVKPD